MDKKKVIIAAVAALLAVMLLFVYIQNMKKKLLDEVISKYRKMEVLVANCDIREGEKLKNFQVDKKNIPENFLPEKRDIILKRKDEVIDKEAIIAIYKGEIITTNKFLDESGGADRLAKLVLPGKRAVTIPVDALSNFNGMLQPGDSVDIVVTTGQRGGIKTFLFLQYIEVIATGQYLKSEHEKVGKGIGEYSTVTFCLNVEDAQKLIFLENAGVDLRFIMRSHSDDKQVQGTVIDRVGKK